MVQEDFQFLLEFLDVCSAVRVAEYPRKVLDGAGVVVGSVVCGIGGVPWYPVWGLVEFWLGGWVLEMCKVAVLVCHLERQQVHGALMHCLDVDLTVPVLVPVGLLCHDLELDVGGEAMEGFPEHQRLGAGSCRGGLVERLSCYAEE